MAIWAFTLHFLHDFTLFVSNKHKSSEEKQNPFPRRQNTFPSPSQLWTNDQCQATCFHHHHISHGTNCLQNFGGKHFLKSTSENWLWAEWITLLVSISCVKSELGRGGGGDIWSGFRSICLPPPTLDREGPKYSSCLLLFLLTYSPTYEKCNFESTIQEYKNYIVIQIPKQCGSSASCQNTLKPRRKTFI